MLVVVDCGFPAKTMRTASALLSLAACVRGAVPSVPLYGVSKPGLTMPAIGLGTGAYGLFNLGYDVCASCVGELRASQRWWHLVVAVGAGPLDGSLLLAE